MVRSPMVASTTLANCEPPSGVVISGPVVNTTPDEPLGIEPRTQWERLRVDAILCAMERHAKAGRAVPIEWVEELRGLVR